LVFQKHFEQLTWAYRCHAWSGRNWSSGGGIFEPVSPNADGNAKIPSKKRNYFFWSTIRINEICA